MTWDDLKDKDVALRVKEATKAKIFPRPDYQTLVDGGMQPIFAHVVKQAYDSISTGPQVRGAPTDEQLQLYITAVNRYMDGVMEWANDSELTGAWLNSVASRASTMLGAARGQLTSLSSMSAARSKSLLESVYPGDWKDFRPEVLIIGANKPLSALQPSTDEAVKAMKDIEKGWPGKQESWQKQGYKIVSGDSPQAGFYEGKRTKNDEPYVSVGISIDGVRGQIESTVLDGVQSKEDAAVQEYVKKRTEELTGKRLLLDKRGKLVGAFDTDEQAAVKARELVKRENNGGIKEEGISVEAAERDGVEHRLEGENVSSEKLIETFGFRGVNFGNWMKGKGNEAERQLHLNHAYDSFMDLAEILNVPPKAMSLGGTLGIAVGAQGSGKALAHFVPGKNEINITRTAGAGALAHEWGHALDHSFARQAGLDRETEPYLSAHATLGATRNRMETVNGKSQTVSENRFGEVRPEIVERFKAIVHRMNKRPLTQEEHDERIKNADARPRKQTDSWLASIRRDFERIKEGSVLADFDKLADRVRNLDLGDGMIAISGGTSIYPVISEIRDLHKKATGRTYNIENIKGLQNNVHWLKMAVEAKEQGNHVPAVDISTNYANASAAADKS